MKIETKFNVGDVVYVCKNNGTHGKEPCKICEGTGVISIKDETFCCTKCHGNKFTNTKRINRFIPEKRTIRKVIVSVSENNGNMQMYTRYETKTHGNRDRSVADYRNIMFATKEEAEYRCKELNQREVRQRISSERKGICHTTCNSSQVSARDGKFLDGILYKYIH